MWGGLQSHFPRSGHEFCGTVTRCAIATVHRWHESAVLMLLVAFVACEFCCHVGLVKLLALMAGHAVCIHRRGFERSFLEQLGGCQSVPERVESLAVPGIHPQFRSIVTSGTAAGIARQLDVEVRERSACVNAGDGARIGEFIAHVAADTYEKDQETGDDGEHDHPLTDGPEGSARLAFGNRIAAGSVRKGAVLALASAGSWARAGPVALHLPRFHGQAGSAFVSRPALSLG